MDFKKGFLVRMAIRAFIVFIWYRVGFESAMGQSVFYEIQLTELLLILTTGIVFLFLEGSLGGVDFKKE